MGLMSKQLRLAFNFSTGVGNPVKQKLRAGFGVKEFTFVKKSI